MGSERTSHRHAPSPQTAERPDVTLADEATRPVEEDWSPADDPLALDPLSPVVSRSIQDAPSPADPLALDPLGPIRRLR
jgi:hypothetical protein